MRWLNYGATTSCYALLPMVTYFKHFYVLTLLATLAYGAPPRGLAFRARQALDSSVGSSTTPIPTSQTVTPASDDPNYPVYAPDAPGPAQPIRGGLGAAILGPQNIPVQQQNPDILAPPSTDNGDVCALSLSNFSVHLFYSCSSDRMQSGPLL